MKIATLKSLFFKKIGHPEISNFGPLQNSFQVTQLHSPYRILKKSTNFIKFSESFSEKNPHRFTSQD